MPSSLSSPSVTEHSHSQPPSPNLHDNQSSVLSNATTQAAQDSDSEEEYTAALYRPVTQPALSHSCNEQPSNQHQQGQSVLPPVPPPHKQQPSVTALNHNSLSSRRNVSPAPPAALPAELQTTPESVPLQDSWVLGSNVPLESRKLAKQAVLENGHDNLIEMDVFPPVCHEGGYGDGYVLLSLLMVPAADAKPNTEPTKVLNLQTPLPTSLHPIPDTPKQKASAEPTKWPEPHIEPTEFRQSSRALVQPPIVYLFPCSVGR
ncbi:teneurin-3 isoform X1 [Labeo rohita]|uniref:Teneurin-3 isoform X1 n=1 Tax=Labeo rohita TaxID=84645 RepID=A0A498L838_LABRO|nr:teneurin-3 isoform X1 [Labeo rohita]